MTKTRIPLLIFGTAELAQLTHFYFREDSDYEVVAFTADDDYVEADTLDGLPVVPWSRALEAYPPDRVHAHVAISYGGLNRLRQAKYEQVRQAGYRLASYVCSKAVTWSDLTIGDNCLVLENQTVQPSCRLGNNVVLWSGNHIGHGTVIGDHTYLASHVVVSGHATIGRRCFFGVNATIKDFIEIGDDCFIAMGALVTRDLASGAVALGKAGEVLDADDRRAKALKKKYFGA